MVYFSLNCCNPVNGLWWNAEPFCFLDTDCLLYVYSIEISSDFCSFLETGFYFSLPFPEQRRGYSFLTVAVIICSII